MRKPIVEWGYSASECSFSPSAGRGANMEFLVVHPICLLWFRHDTARRTSCSQSGKPKTSPQRSTPGNTTRLESPIENELCFTCHGSYEALAEKTADGTVLTDKTGTVVNPHAIPANGEHNEEPACKNCHKMHGDSDPQEYCRSCHHADVYECGTCHE